MFLIDKFAIHYLPARLPKRPNVRKGRIAIDFGIAIEDRCALKAATEVRSWRTTASGRRASVASSKGQPCNGKRTRPRPLHSRSPLVASRARRGRVSILGLDPTKERERQIY